MFCRDHAVTPTYLLGAEDRVTHADRFPSGFDHTDPADVEAVRRFIVKDIIDFDPLDVAVVYPSVVNQSTPNGVVQRNVVLIHHQDIRTMRVRLFRAYVDQEGTEYAIRPFRETKPEIKGVNYLPVTLGG